VKMGEVESGAVELHNLSEHIAADSNALLGMIAKAKAKRCVAATEMNDASSRSHGVAIFTIEHTAAGVGSGPQPQNGKLYVIDLAGSESAKDMRKHDKARMDETKQINISLNALKECIQARTLASSPGSAANTHVPFRRSKLTLLLKDIFDIHCPRITATVVLATVNPMAKDVGQSKTTLGYAAPLREAVGMFGRNRKKTAGQRGDKKKSKKKKKNVVVLEVDVLDPALWSPERLSNWLHQEHPNTSGLDGLSGLQLCALPETELFVKIGDPVHAAKVAKSLWGLIVAAKLVKRRPDGTILSDEVEAAEKAAEKAADEARYEAQAAKAAAAIKADLAVKGLE